MYLSRRSPEYEVKMYDTYNDKVKIYLSLFLAIFSN